MNDWEGDPGNGNPTLEVSSELDWMRFFWNLTSDDADGLRSSPAPGAPIELIDVLDLYEAAMAISAPGEAPFWVHFETASDSTAFAARFDDMTTIYGVNNGQGLP
jgi:hypothetical protein